MKFTEDYNKLKSVLDTDGRTVAYVQAKGGWTTEDIDILKLKNRANITVLTEILKKSNWVPSNDIKDSLIDNKTIWEHYTNYKLKNL